MSTSSSDSSSGQSKTMLDHLPIETLQQIFSHMTLRQTLTSRTVSKLFNTTLTSPTFLPLLPNLPLLALRHPRHHPNPTSLLSFDPSLHLWLHLPLPLPSSPVTSSPSLLYLWTSLPPKSLIVSNPLTRSYRLLPPLGSAWSKHGTVLAAEDGKVLVLTELAAILYVPGEERWLKFSLNLPSKPRSPVLIGGDTVYAICDVGSPWRIHWKMFRCGFRGLGRSRGWERVEREEWGEVFNVLKRPRLIRGRGNGRILMVGGLRSAFAVDAPCSTVLILRLDLGNSEWDEAGRMPADMYECFGGVGAGGGNNKVKLFGGDGMVWFSGKKVRGKMAMWEEEREGVKGSGGVWRWVDGMPGYGDGVYRGFMLNASLTAAP